MILTVTDIFRRVRSRLDDLNQPYLWSDAELYDCLNDTVSDAAIRASLTVQDDMPIAFTQNVDLTWKSKYALPAGTILVEEVYLQSQPDRTLTQTSFRRWKQLSNSRPVNFQESAPYAYALDQTQPGVGDDAGIQVRTITFIGAPNSADTAMVNVVRLPALLESGSDIPEIDGMWHPDLVYGITGLAYLKKDADTFDPSKSAKDLKVFEDRFGPRLPASVMRERQTDVPLEMTLN